MDLQEAFDAGFEAVKGYVDRSFAAFETRIAALEARQPEKGEKGDKGDPGADGKDGEPGTIDADQVAAISAEMARSVGEAFARDAIAALPPPQKGERGEKGDPGERGADGKDGAPGIDGRDGADGLAGRDADEAAMMAAVMERIDAIAIPKDGAPGKNGVGLAGAMIGREGDLIVTLSDGSHHNLGLVVGRDGVPGEKGQDGRDGFGFEDMTVDYDGERTLTVKFTRGEHSKSFTFPLAAIIYRGVWHEGPYEKGDCVTFGGSGWIATKDTTDKPETSDAWKLFVKRGRDGRDGKLLPGPPATVKVGS